MSTIGRDYARGCWRSLVIRAIAGIIGLPLIVICALVPLALTISFDLPPWMLAASLGLFLVILFGGGALAIWITLASRKRRFDAAFAPLGLAGRAYATFFRQYHGAIAGRPADVYFTRGPLLEIELGTALQTRLGVTGAQGDTRFLADLAGRQPLRFSDRALANLTVFALDEAWARNLLGDPQVVELLQRLTATRGSYTRQQVLLRPGAAKLMLSGSRRTFGFDLDPAQVRRWTDDLLALLALAEATAPPTAVDVESPAEQLSRRIRQRNPYIGLWAGLGLLVGMLLCSAVIVAALLILRP